MCSTGPGVYVVSILPSTAAVSCAVLLGQRVRPGLRALGGQVAQRDLGTGHQRAAPGQRDQVAGDRVHRLDPADRAGRGLAYVVGQVVALRPAPPARAAARSAGVRSTCEACSAKACSEASRSWSCPAEVSRAWLIALASGIWVRGRSRSNRPRPSWLGRPGELAERLGEDPRHHVADQRREQRLPAARGSPATRGRCRPGRPRPRPDCRRVRVPPHRRRRRSRSGRHLRRRTPCPPTTIGVALAGVVRQPVGGVDDTGEEGAVDGPAQGGCAARSAATRSTPRRAARGSRGSAAARGRCRSGRRAPRAAAARSGRRRTPSAAAAPGDPAVSRRGCPRGGTRPRGQRRPSPGPRRSPASGAAGRW